MSLPDLTPAEREKVRSVAYLVALACIAMRQPTTQAHPGGPYSLHPELVQEARTLADVVVCELEKLQGATA
ncbi:MAG: hypothetical protein ACRETH_01635 [Steroidobacteraceae bacterium]